MKKTQLISLNNARKQGLKFYFTGNLCSRHHLSKRYVTSRACFECCKEHSRSNTKRYQMQAKYRIKQRQLILNKLGNKCVRCGIVDFRVLQVDHVDGGGRKDIDSFSSHNRYYKSILLDQTDKFQLLCANCNWIKRYENKEIAYSTRK